MDFRLTHDAAESDMRGRGIEGLALPRRGPVAQAIIRRTEMRAALHHPVCGAIGALLWLATGWLFGRGMRQGIAARRPFPDIGDHGVKPVTVGRVRADWRGALVAIFGEIFPGKAALPGVRHDLALGCNFLAPGIGR